MLNHDSACSRANVFVPLSQHSLKVVEPNDASIFTSILSTAKSPGNNEVIIQLAQAWREIQRYNARFCSAVGFKQWNRGSHSLASRREIWMLPKHTGVQ